MKKLVNNDEKTTSVNKPGVGKATQRGTSNGPGKGVVNPASQAAQTKPGTRKIRPAPVKARIRLRKSERSPSITTKATTRTNPPRSTRITASKDRKKQFMNEWNLMEVDDFTDEFFDESSQSKASNAQQDAREKLVGNIMQEILSEEIPENNPGNAATAKPNDPASSQEQIESANPASGASQGSRLVRPLGFSLLGKTWGIKAMVGLTILIGFLLVNQFVFVGNNPPLTLAYLTGTATEDQGIIPNARQEMVEANLLGEVDVAHQGKNPNDDGSERRDLNQAMERSIGAGEESKPDQEISIQELNFWQDLATTSLVEITEIQSSLAQLPVTFPVANKHVVTSNDKIHQNHQISMDPSNQAGISPSIQNLTIHEENSEKGNTQLVTPRKKTKSTNSQNFSGKMAAEIPFKAEIGMEEKIATPFQNIAMAKPPVVLVNDQLKSDGIAFKPNNSELEGVVPILLTLTEQIEALNFTTQDMLSFLRETKPLFNDLATIPDQGVQFQQQPQRSGPELVLNLAEKFRISDFPGMVKVKTEINPDEVASGNTVGPSSKVVKVLEFNSALVQEEELAFPVLATQSDDQLVIRSFSQRESGYAALADVGIGDVVPGFGLVINIKMDGTGRLIVMENGIVYLN